MNALLWGLAGAILIGASDCIARVTTQRCSSSVLILHVMGLSSAALTLWLLLQESFPPWHGEAWLASALSGMLNIVALYFIYTALKRGPVAVASPAASTFSVLLVLMNVLSGEAFNSLQLLAVPIVFGGIVMLSRPPRSMATGIQEDAAWLRVTAAYGLAAAFSVALRMFLAQEAGNAIGAIHALYLNRLFALLSVLLLIVVLLWRSTPLQWPVGRTRALVVLQAALETAALAAFLVGSAGDGRVGASIGFSAFAAATVLFARIWLGEKVGLWRSGWIAVVVAGLALAAAAGQR